ncbi:MAG: BadF/BadG/BcrA/BcrD ATPase family protein [Capsulimonadaceae bacterium]
MNDRPSVEFVIGLDGGGTKVQSAVASLDGTIVGTGQSGPCNIASMPVADAFVAARTACVEALAAAGLGSDDIVSVCAAVAGASVEANRIELEGALALLFPAAVVSVEPDYAAALTGGTGGAAGIVVIAGTGSVAYGEDAGGNRWRCGGYGYRIDDDGSGYGVGRRAVSAALKAADGTGPATTLTGPILAAFEITSPSDLPAAVYGRSANPVDIAALAPLVVSAANAGDEAAGVILRQAGGALARLCAGVAQRLFASEECFPLITVGSLWRSGPPLTDVFERSVNRFAPGAQISLPRDQPVAGAVMRAIRRL